MTALRLWYRDGIFSSLQNGFRHCFRRDLNADMYRAQRISCRSGGCIIFLSVCLFFSLNKFITHTHTTWRTIIIPNQSVHVKYHIIIWFSHQTITCHTIVWRRMRLSFNQSAERFFATGIDFRDFRSRCSRHLVHRFFFIGARYYRVHGGKNVLTSVKQSDNELRGYGYCSDVMITISAMTTVMITIKMAIKTTTMITT